MRFADEPADRASSRQVTRFSGPPCRPAPQLMCPPNGGSSRASFVQAHIDASRVGAEWFVLACEATRTRGGASGQLLAQRLAGFIGDGDQASDLTLGNDSILAGACVF